MHLASKEVEAVVDTGASASAVGKRLVYKWEIWKRLRKVNVRYEDVGFLVGNCVVNTLFKVMDSSSVLYKFEMDAEVLNVGNRDISVRSSWLTENGFAICTQDRCLRIANKGCVIPCSVRWISKVLIMEEELLENGEILLIIGISEQYTCHLQCFSTAQAARLSEHKP